MLFIRKNSAAGVTLVEIMIVVAIVAISYLGVIVLMNKVTQGTWSLTRTTELTSQMRQAMNWIGEDFKNAKASSMGNLVDNYGFETPFDLNQPALTGWIDAANSPVGPGQAVNRVGGGGPNIKGGFKSLALAAVDTTDYFSNTITIPDNGQYVISSWVKADKTTASFSLVQGDKTDFALPIIEQNNNNYYVHLTTAVLLNAGQPARLKLSKPDNIWNFDYDTTAAAVIIWDFCVFKGNLYAGTGQNGRIYVKHESDQWVPGVSLGTWVRSFCVFQGRLYAGTYAPARIYVTDDGITWTVSYDPPPNTVTVFYTLCEYKGRLFAGTNGSPSPIARIFAFDGGVNWAEVMTLPETEIFHLCVYRDKLFAGTYSDDKIYAHEGNDPATNWSVAYDVVAVNNTAVKRLCVYKDVLYAATYSSGNIYYHTGDVPTANWNIAYTKPGGNPGNKILESLCVYKDNLYMGTSAEGRIYKHGGDIPTLNWNIDFDSISTEAGIESFGVYEDKLYAGRDIFVGQPTCQIYVLGGAGYFDDVAISPSAVVFDNTTLIDGTHNVYKYNTSRGNDGSVYYDRLKLYRLRYVTVAAPDPAAPGELFRERWVGPGANDYEIVSGEPLAKNVKSLRITNNNQESFEVELVLEKTKGGKTQEYRIKNTFTPLVK